MSDVFAARLVHKHAVTVITALGKFALVHGAIFPRQLALARHGIVLPFSFVGFLLPNLGPITVALSVSKVPSVTTQTVRFGECAKSMFKTTFVLALVDFSVHPSMYASSMLLPIQRITIVRGPIGPLKKTPAIQMSRRPLTRDRFTIGPHVGSPSGPRIQLPMARVFLTVRPTIFAKTVPQSIHHVTFVHLAVGIAHRTAAVGLQELINAACRRASGTCWRSTSSIWRRPREGTRPVRVSAATVKAHQVVCDVARVLVHVVFGTNRRLRIVGLLMHHAAVGIQMTHAGTHVGPQVRMMIATGNGSIVLHNHGLVGCLKQSTFQLDALLTQTESFAFQSGQHATRAFLLFFFVRRQGRGGYGRGSVRGIVQVVSLDGFFLGRRRKARDDARVQQGFRGDSGSGHDGSLLRSLRLRLLLRILWLLRPKEPRVKNTKRDFFPPLGLVECVASLFSQRRPHPKIRFRSVTRPTRLLVALLLWSSSRAPNKQASERFNGESLAGPRGGMEYIDRQDLEYVCCCSVESRTPSGINTTCVWDDSTFVAILLYGRGVIFWSLIQVVPSSGGPARAARSKR
mmetsp:Transcript_18070/g.42663  ORF Transcript_18070/g.42663 Transcript_18070/m.42663 type:complete len:572 (+) Transcript_18070:731-2446(+)